MTTYQDPPLHSRRAARQGERADAENTTSNSSAERSGSDEPHGEPLNYATTSRPPLPQYDGQNFRPRRTVESTDPADIAPTQALPRQDLPNYRSRDFSPEGGRSQPSWGPQYGGVGHDGTVEFQTQVRASVPVTVPENEPTEPASNSAASAEESVVDTSAVVDYYAEHTMTRRELRALREAGLITDVTDLSQPIPVQPPLAAPEAEVAQEVADEPAAAAPVAEAPAAEVPAAEAPIVEAPAAVAPIAEPIPLVAPAPQQSTRLDSALAEFDALASGREPLLPGPDAPAPVTGRRSAGPLLADDTVPDNAGPDNSVADDAAFPQAEPLPPSTEGLSAFDALFQPPSAAVPVVVALPLDSDVEHHDVVEAVLEPEAASTSSAEVDALLAAPAPQGAPALVPPPAAYPAAVDLPAPPAESPAAPSAAPSASNPFLVAAPPSSEPTAAVVEPSLGHWSTQADIDDAEQINESTISRSVGAGNTAITTSALVLPSVPDHTIGGPLGDSGQILLTGSISLPESLSATGAHPSQLDESDLDHLLDLGDYQVANTDSTPVRAIRAVSTHTASGGIISPTKPKGTRGFTILIIAASVMAVVVVGLLIAGLVSGTL